MAGNPVDSVLVKFELNTEGLSDRLNAIKRQINEAFKNDTYKVALSVGINKADLAKLHTEIRDYFKTKPIPLTFSSKATGESGGKKSSENQVSVLEAKLAAAQRVAQSVAQTSMERVRQAGVVANTAIGEATQKALEATGTSAAKYADVVEKANQGAVSSARLASAKIAQVNEQAAIDSSLAASKAQARSQEASARSASVAKDVAAKIKVIKAEEALDVAKAADAGERAAVRIAAAERVAQEQIRAQIAETARLRAVATERALASRTAGTAHTAKTAGMSDVLLTSGLTGPSAKQTVQTVKQIVPALRESAAETQKVAAGFHMARSNAELMASSIFTVRNVMAALSTLGVFRVFTGIRDASADFETALANIAKTTNLADQPLAVLSANIQEMSTRLPIATKELLGIANAAGQVGVTGVRGLTKFTEALGMLSLATDVQGEEGARQVARILNLTKTSPESADRFASALVSLGNSAAATEREILEVATKVSQSVAVFGMSAEAVLGLSTAMRELGVEAELGGTQIGLMFQALNLAAMSRGSESASTLEKLGLDIENFREQLRNAPDKALLEFIEKLSHVDTSQIDRVFRSLGFEGGSRNMRVFGPLSQNALLLKTRLEQSSRAWKENIAAIVEVDRQSRTFNGQMTMMRNAIGQVVKALGDDMNPYLLSMSHRLVSIATADIPNTVLALKSMGVALSALAAVKVPLFATDILIGLKRLDMLRKEQRTIIKEAAVAEAGLSSTLIRIGTKFGGVSTVGLTAIAALAAGVYYYAGRIGKSFTGMGDATKALSSWEVLELSIKSIGDTAKTSLPWMEDFADAVARASTAQITVPGTGGQTASVSDTTSGIWGWLKGVPSDLISAAKDAPKAVANAADVWMRNMQDTVSSESLKIQNDLLVLSRILVKPWSTQGADQLTSAIEQNRAALNNLSQDYDEWIRKPKFGDQAEIDLLKSLVTATSEKNAPTLEPLVAFSAAAVKDLASQIGNTEKFFATFVEGHAKAEVALQEMRLQTENSRDEVGRYKNEFADFLASKGLESFALLARNQTGALALWNAELVKAEAQLASLNDQIITAKETNPDLVKGLEDSAASLKENISMWKQSVSETEDMNRVLGELETQFSSSKMEAFLKENREALADFKIASGELSKDVMQYDIPTLQKWSKELGTLSHIFVGIGNDVLQAAQDNLYWDTQLSNQSALRAAEYDVELLNEQLSLMRTMGPQAGAAYAQFLNAIASTPEGRNLLDSGDKSRIDQAFFGAQSLLAQIKSEETLSDFDQQIASITHNSEDMARALGISTDEYDAMANSVGGISARFAEFLLTLVRTPEQLEELRGQLGLLKERVDEMVEAERLKELSDGIAGAFGNMADSMVDALLNAENVLDGFKEAFREFANQIIKEIIRIFIINRMMEAISGGLGSLLGGGPNSSGSGIKHYPGAFAKGAVFPFAKGGVPHNSVVSAPTMAPMALFAEKYPEAIMPLRKGKQGLGVYDVTTGKIIPLSRGPGGVLGIATPSVSALSSGGVFTGPSPQALAPVQSHEYNGGKGPTIYMDLRGSNGDASIEAAVEKGIRRAAPQLVNASVNKVLADKRRDPNMLRK